MVAYTGSTSHITCPRSDNTHGIIDKSGVGTVGQTSSKNSDFHTKFYLLGVATYWVVYVNLFFWEEFSKKGMRNLNNQTAQLVGTSWD